MNGSLLLLGLEDVELLLLDHLGLLEDAVLLVFWRMRERRSTLLDVDVALALGLGWLCGLAGVLGVVVGVVGALVLAGGLGRDGVPVVLVVFGLVLEGHLLDLVDDLLDLELFWLVAVDDGEAEGLGDLLVDLDVEVEVLVFAEVGPAEGHLERVAVDDGQLLPEGDPGRRLAVLLDLEAAVLEAEHRAVVAVQQGEDQFALVGVLAAAPV